MSSKTKPLDDFERDYAREDLRHQVIGMIGLLLQDQKREGRSSQADIAKRLDVDPGQISRWLHGDINMTLNTVADLVEALDGKIEFAVRDAASGRLYHQEGIREGKDQTLSISTAWHAHPHLVVAVLSGNDGPSLAALSFTMEPAVQNEALYDADSVGDWRQTGSRPLTDKYVEDFTAQTSEELEQRASSSNSTPLKLQYLVPGHG